MTDPTGHKGKCDECGKVRELREYLGHMICTPCWKPLNKHDLEFERSMAHRKMIGMGKGILQEIETALVALNGKDGTFNKSFCRCDPSVGQICETCHIDGTLRMCRKYIQRCVSNDWDILGKWKERQVSDKTKP